MTLVICDRLEIAPEPFLIAEVLASNIGGAATLIGDPPNIIIGSRAGLTFNDFLVNMAPVVVVIFVLFALFTKFLFRKDLRANDMRLEKVMALQERRAIKDTRLLVRSMVVLALVIAGFSLHSVLHVAPSIVALLGAGAMLLVTNVEVTDVLPRGGMADIGVLHGPVRHGRRSGAHRCNQFGLGDAAVTLFGDDFFLAATGLLFGSAVLRHVRRRHSVYGDDDSGGRGHDRAGTRRRDRQGTVVGIRTGSVLLRQRHRDRRERQCRSYRHRATGG